MNWSREVPSQYYIFYTLLFKNCPRLLQVRETDKKWEVINTRLDKPMTLSVRIRI